MQQKLNISSRAFWDVDFEKLLENADRNASYIIRRTFEYGKFQDILNVINYFGKQQVIHVLTNAHFLPEKTLHFASAIFKLEKSNFKCYTHIPHRHFSSTRSKI
jgi:hypothetical protein